jgi:hypothetical protein
MKSKLRLAYWWYITVQQYPYHPKKYRKDSTLEEKSYRDYLARKLSSGKRIMDFNQSELTRGGF